MSYYAFVPNPASLAPVNRRGLFGLGALSYDQQLAIYNSDLALWKKEKAAYDKALAKWQSTVKSIDRSYQNAMSSYAAKASSYASKMSAYSSAMASYSQNLARLKSQNRATSKSVAQQYGLTIPDNFECVTKAANTFYNSFDCTVVKGIGLGATYNLYGSACGARNLPVCNYPSPPKHPGSAPVAPKKAKYPPQPAGLRAKPVPPTPPPATPPTVDTLGPPSSTPPSSSPPLVPTTTTDPGDDVAAARKAKMIKGGILAAVVVVGGVVLYRTFK